MGPVKCAPLSVYVVSGLEQRVDAQLDDMLPCCDPVLLFFFVGVTTASLTLFCSVVSVRRVLDQEPDHEITPAKLGARLPGVMKGFSLQTFGQPYMLALLRHSAMQQHVRPFRSVFHHLIFSALV